MSKKRDSKKIPAEGERWNCRSCGQPMQRWKHAPDWTPQPGKGWYTFWFECLNKRCRTKQVMPPGAYVKPGDDGPKGGAGSGSGGSNLDPFGYEQLLCAEDIQRLAHFRGMTMTATVIPPEVLARRREARDRQRREREALKGSILETADESEQRVCVASERRKITQ